MTRWFRLGGSDLVMLLIVLGVGQTASRQLLGDPGIGWHVRTAEVIAESGWPTGDPYSLDAQGNYWLANQWLGEFVLWAGWNAAGLNGIVAVVLFVLAVAYRILYGFLRADGVPWPVAVGWTLMAALGSYYIWTARPNLFTFLAVTLLARVFVLYHEGRLSSARLLWVPVLFAVWANAHGGFIAGFLIGGVAVAVEAGVSIGHPDAPERLAARRRCWVLVGVGLGSAAATLLNPYGWRVYPWIFSLLGDDYFMNLNVEWHSPNFHEPGSARIERLFLLFPALLAVSRHRPNLVLTALAVAWFHLALQGCRYVPLWVMVTVPLLARAGLELDVVNRWYASRPDVSELFGPPRGGWVGVLVLAAGLAVWAKTAPAVRHDQEFFPTQGLDTLLEQWKPGEVVVHSPNFGGYLTWHGWPAFRVWMDDRNEVYGKAGYVAYLDLQNARPGWEKELAEARATWVVVPADCPLADRLSERPGEWDRVFRDDQIDVFRRKYPPVLSALPRPRRPSP